MNELGDAMQKMIDVLESKQKSSEGVLELAKLVYKQMGLMNEMVNATTALAVNGLIQSQALTAILIEKGLATSEEIQARIDEISKECGAGRVA